MSAQSSIIAAKLGYPRTKAEILETRLRLYYPWRKRGTLQQTMPQYHRAENIRRGSMWLYRNRRSMRKFQGQMWREFQREATSR